MNFVTALGWFAVKQPLLNVVRRGCFFDFFALKRRCIHSHLDNDAHIIHTLAGCISVLATFVPLFVGL